jgi:hypothetical protein
VIPIFLVYYPIVDTSPFYRAQRGVDKEEKIEDEE